MTNGPHSNPVWSTFIFVICMLLFLFYLESMINPMDFLVSKSFVVREYRIGQNYQAFLPINNSKFITYEEVLNGSFDMNNHGNTLVSLHIQKTAGKAFGAHIALDINPDSGPVCNCTREADEPLVDLQPGSCVCDLDSNGASQWFFNRLTVGWPCGVHAGWTELSLNCLDKSLNYQERRKASRRYAKITILSNPMARYLREWRQVSSNGQWPIEHMHCHPLQGTKYFDGNWVGVTLDSFLRCRDNPANNRQVRMLANLTQTQCDDVTDALTRDRHDVTAEPDHVKNISTLLLDSAMENLKQIPYFGLLEYPTESDRLFEYTFGVRLSKQFINTEADILSSVKTTAHQKETISEYNKLDKKLYEFAKILFFERLENMAKIYSRITRPTVI